MGHMRAIASSVVILSLLLVLSATAVPGTAAGGADWVVHDTAPIERIVYAYAQLPDGRIFVASGADIDGTPTLTNETWIYDPEAKSWEQKADMNISESACCAAMPDGNVYVFGGMNGPLLTHVLVYDVAGDTWSEGPELPTGLILSEAAAVNDHQVLIAGGATTGYFANTTAACWMFDTDTGDFTALADMPAARCCGMMAISGSTAYFFGGLDADVTPHDDIFAYDIIGNEWSTVGKLPGVLVNAAVVSSGHGSIYLIGGETYFSWYGDGLAKAYSFDTFSYEFTELPDLPAPVLNSAVFMLDGGRLMYLLGNSAGDGNTDVMVLQTGEAKATLSANDVDQGNSVWLHIWVETEQDIGTLSGSVYLVKDNVTYGEWHFTSGEGANVMVEIAVSEGLPAGDYLLKVEELNVNGWWLDRHFSPMPLTVNDVPSTQERLDSLDQQNQALQDRLDDLEAQNQGLQDQLNDTRADLKEAVDAKLDAMIGYVILIVALGALIVGVVILLRKK